MSAFSELDGIVSVRDFFYANLTAYIVMAYVEGVSLKTYVEVNGRIEGTLFLEMLKPILFSLAKVHETGVLHRDISPDNILITKENKMVLIDFGAARKENISMTRSMTVVFKQGYSPEEQYRSHGKQGAWSDIYALCATAYYALTGRRPDEAIERVLEDEMQSLEDYGHRHVAVENPCHSGCRNDVWTGKTTVRGRNGWWGRIRWNGKYCRENGYTVIDNEFVRGDETF